MTGKRRRATGAAKRTTTKAAKMTNGSRKQATRSKCVFSMLDDFHACLKRYCCIVLCGVANQSTARFAPSSNSQWANRAGARQRRPRRTSPLGYCRRGIMDAIDDHDTVTAALRVGENKPHPTKKPKQTFPADKQIFHYRAPSLSLRITSLSPTDSSAFPFGLRRPAKRIQKPMSPQPPP